MLGANPSPSPGGWFSGFSTFHRPPTYPCERGMIMRTGRPTLDKKDSTLKLRLNDDMRLWAEMRAKMLDISLSEYIRVLIRHDMRENKQ